MRVRRYYFRRFHRWVKRLLGMKEPDLLVVPTPTIIGLDHQGRIHILYQSGEEMVVAKLELHEVMLAMLQVPIADPDGLIEKIMKA